MDIINIMLVEDHPVFRQGLRRILESQKDMQVIIEVADGAQALRLAREMAPQVIVMDVNLPSMNGLQVTHSIKKELPNVAVVMLTAYHNDEQLFHAIRAGASAYYPKDVTPRKLVEAVRQVSQGNYVIDDTVLDKPQFAKWLTKEFERMGTGWKAPEELFVPLSPREMEILNLVTKGKSNKEIALQLGISHQTVKNHMTSILRKMSVNDRTQAAVDALRRGWVRLQDTVQED
ncbi:MAG: DNA-binding response regulator [Anaerolineaceae bacterium 4572_32.1]|nr:MAG: DNA-binding response regulator [Anaerolineaceae bacterium 4572_32.1]